MCGVVQSKPPSVSAEYGQRFARIDSREPSRELSTSLGDLCSCAIDCSGARRDLLSPRPSGDQSVGRHIVRYALRIRVHQVFHHRYHHAWLRAGLARFWLRRRRFCRRQNDRHGFCCSRRIARRCQGHRYQPPSPSTSGSPCLTPPVSVRVWGSTTSRRTSSRLKSGSTAGCRCHERIGDHDENAVTTICFSQPGWLHTSGPMVLPSGSIVRTWPARAASTSRLICGSGQLPVRMAKFVRLKPPSHSGGSPASWARWSALKGSFLHPPRPVP